MTEISRVNKYFNFKKEIAKVVHEYVDENKSILLLNSPDGKKFTSFDNSASLDITMQIDNRNVPNKSSMAISFNENFVSKELCDSFHVIVDNGGLSLTLDNEINRLTTFDNHILNENIDRIPESFHAKFKKILYLMSDFEAFSDFSASRLF
ncbi:hypothetical protein [Anaerotalea alkaliphila]|uniref:Uncharacterized protein n=1 Tax=Anaerotalea alkaliphila TaxID=2662126 RepID=A0A7X5HXM3_9FIRM|nr:hypothetical protein [Anaerotalea alkaliphila]NDL68481.1 hypothetical protein [Anaerotalea alkaliphila]